MIFGSAKDLDASDSFDFLNFGRRRGQENDSKLELTSLTVNDRADYNVDTETMKTNPISVSGFHFKNFKISLYSFHFRFRFWNN